VKKLILSLLLAGLAGSGCAAPAKVLCDTSDAALASDNVDAISAEFDTQFVKVFGKNWAMTKSEVRAKAKVDQPTMGAIAKLAGCAAVIDKESSCSIFFDPEFSMTLGVFTDLPRSVPLRKQFDAAIAALPDGKEKQAALACLKLVAKK
jgi:hypothetical protein